MTVSHTFSFDSNPDGARGVAAELRRRGFARIWLGEEISGDGYWHVVARRRQALNERVFVNARRELRRLAVTNGGVYDGWSVQSGGDTLLALLPRRH